MILEHKSCNTVQEAPAWELQVDMSGFSCGGEGFVLLCLLVNKVISSIFNIFHKTEQLAIK